MTAKTESGFEFPDDEEYKGMVFEQEGDLVVNLTEVKEMVFELIPKGVYPATIIGADYGNSQTSGAPMIAFEFQITEGKYQGKKMRSWVSFSPKALPGSKATLGRISPELVTMPFKPAELCAQSYFTNKPVRLRVDIGEYNGEKRSQVRGIMAAASNTSADGVAA